MIRHRPTVGIGLAVWLLMYSHLVHAATLAQSMDAYDWASMRWSLGLAVLGGFLRLLFTLATDTRIVWQVLRESWRNAILSLVAGLACFWAIEAAKSVGMSVTEEVRFGAITLAGALGIDFINWGLGLVRDWARTKRLPEPPAAP